MLEPLGSLENLATLLTTDFLLSNGSEAGLGPLVRLIFSKLSRGLK
jgi:hypothetical protein